MRVTSGMFHGLNPSPSLNHGRWPSVPSQGSSNNINNKINALLMSTTQFLANSGPRASQLQGTLVNMQSVVNRITAASENTDVMRVRSFSGSTVPDTSVLVQQVATTQRNEGTAMPANARDIPSGTFQFEIEVDGTTRQISFTTSEALTNQAFQQRMAEAINQAGIGVTASVTSATANGATTSTLNIETRTTGAGANGEPRFTIRDVSGNAVAATGAANVTQYAQHAKFSVNGGDQRTSASNDIDLPGGLNITLVSASEEAVGIVPGRDSAGKQNGVRNVVDQFNALLEAARGNSMDLRTRALASNLESAMRRNRAALQEIGVQISDRGFLTIDSERLRTASESGAVGSFFGADGGRPNNFAITLGRIAESVSTNPMRHVSPHAPRMPGFNAALNAATRGNANQQASRFDAYFQDDPLEHLLSLLR